MNDNIENWDNIYKKKKSGSFLNYPSENLVTLFHQHKTYINKNGNCLDYGFGSANNTEFLIQQISEVYGVEISESSIEIAKERLSKFHNFRPEKFTLANNESTFDNYFDTIVAWQMLCYNDKNGLKESINKLHTYLKPKGVIFCTLTTQRDIKTIYAKPESENTFVIDDRIPHQTGCLIYAPKSSDELLDLFSKFEVIDHGHFERISYQTRNAASEFYLIGQKK